MNIELFCQGSCVWDFPLDARNHFFMIKSCCYYYFMTIMTQPSSLFCSIILSISHVLIQLILITLFGKFYHQSHFIVKSRTKLSYLIKVTVRPSLVSTLIFKSLCYPLCYNFSCLYCILGGHSELDFEMDYLHFLHKASVHSLIQHVNPICELTKFRPSTNLRTFTRE